MKNYYCIITQTRTNNWYETSTTITERGIQPVHYGLYKFASFSERAKFIEEYEAPDYRPQSKAFKISVKEIVLYFGEDMFQAFVDGE